MPEKIEHQILKSLIKAHPDWTDDKLKDVMYATMMKKGLMKKKHKGIAAKAMER